MDPDGKIVAGPANEREAILYADVRRNARRCLDGSSTSEGTTPGPTSSSFIVHRKSTPMIQERVATSPSRRPPQSRAKRTRRK